MEKVLVLDNGYVQFIEKWGSDERIIESARMSTGKGFNGWGPVCAKCHTSKREDGYACAGSGGHAWEEGDEKLLRFLWENKHATPFEMAGVTIEVCAPIFVFREWHRHRVPFGYNEMSARYTQLPAEDYIPTVERLMIGSDGKNKQAGTIAGAEVLTLDSALEWLAELADAYDHNERVYQSGLRRGIPKELARLPLPVGRYSRMRATSNLRGWLAFLSLRSTAKNPAAQWEIRQYADAVGNLLLKEFPRTMELFNEVPEHIKQRAALRGLLELPDIPANIREAIKAVVK